MKNLILTRKNILGTALLTAFVGALLLTSATAQAAPDADPRSSSNDKRRGNNDDRRRDERRDNRRDDRRDDNRRDSTLTGVVTAVRSGNSFDVRSGNKIYNVNTASSLPRGLSVGDTVRVSGQPYGDNDYRRASVSITSNVRDRDGRPGRDGRDANYDAYRTYRGTVEILLPNDEFNARIDGRMYKVYATESTRSLRVGDPISIYGQLDRGVNIRNARITADGRGDGRDNRRGDRDSRSDYTNGRYDPNGKLGGNRGDYRPDNNRRDFNTYVGEVTEVRNSRELRVRISGRDYDVYSDNTVRDVRRGDRVSVYGTRFGDNDIRDARVTVTRDRNNDNRDDDRNNYGSYRTYNGVVTNVKNSREFDVRIDGRTYNVTTDDSTRGLDRGDEVRIYGRTYGANDIRNANVRVTRNR